MARSRSTIAKRKKAKQQKIEARKKRDAESVPAELIGRAKTIAEQRAAVGELRDLGNLKKSIMDILSRKVGFELDADQVWPLIKRISTPLHSAKPFTREERIIIDFLKRSRVSDNKLAQLKSVWHDIEKRLSEAER